MTKPVEKITIGGREYSKFIPYPKAVRDGTVRCFACGQIDEPEHHEAENCPAMSSGDRRAPSVERPILFSYAMVKALLAGRKTQTRRLVKPQPPAEAVDVGYFQSWNPATHGLWAWLDYPDMEAASILGDEFRCPYGVPGDRLWVREAFTRVPASAYRMSEGVQQTVDPNEPDMAAIYAVGWDRSIPKWKPSIHMPRWASRILLDVVNVRIERLNDITVEDAIAEGLEWVAPGMWAVDTSLAIIGDDPRAVYRELWEHINGADSWEANPWVWVVEFKRGHTDGLA